MDDFIKPKLTWSIFLWRVKNFLFTIEFSYDEYLRNRSGIDYISTENGYYYTGKVKGVVFGEENCRIKKISNFTT